MVDFATYMYSFVRLSAKNIQQGLYLHASFFIQHAI